MNYVNWPLISSFKMVPCGDLGLSNMHMDFDYVSKQVRSFEIPTYYKQKWCIADTTKLQVESTIAPSDLKIYQCIHGMLITAKTIAWNTAFAGTDYNVYELTFDVSDLAPGVYVLWQQFKLISIDWQYLSEPINLQVSHPGTRYVDYKHKFNDYGVAWNTGLKMRFRCEMDILDYEPDGDRTEYSDQLKSVDTLFAVPSRIFKLIIGDAQGVPPYVVDIMNRIMLCSYTNFEGKLYARAIGSKWSSNLIRGNRMMGTEVQVVEADNVYSLQFNDAGSAPIAAGIVAAYNIDTTVFGGGTIVPIIDVQIHE